MQTLLTKAKATETETKKLQKKRNLFGLGVTSLIAACSGADGAAGGGPATLPFKAEKAKEDKGGFTASLGASDPLTVAITGDAAATLTFNDGQKDGSRAYIYKLTATDAQHDLVVSSYTIDTNKGGIFIFWNMAGIKDEIIGAGSETTTNPRLEIKGAIENDEIGTYAPDFLYLDGDTKYDMVIRSNRVDKPAVDPDPSIENAGAIYILWDVADYGNDNVLKTIVLGSTATHGSLSIYGATADDEIGIIAPEFLKLGGTDNKYDMVIRAQNVDKPAVDPDPNIENAGAIYILWDVADYAGKNKTIDLGVGNNDDDLYATSGLLTIYGATTESYIGTHAPDFLQIGGTSNNYDMVIAGQFLDNLSGASSTGAIFILWDVADYAGKNKTIDLSNPADEATAGSLAIYGAAANDKIGSPAPKFSHLDGDTKYDMLIRSEFVGSNKGAIYILWDVVDYAGKNTTIDLGNPADDSSTNVGATSGSLAIYGAAANDKIGSRAPEFLHLDGDTKYDMVIRSQLFGGDKGAIYVLWDVADYAGENTTIDLGNPADDSSTNVGATSGSLAIHGAGISAAIGTYAPDFFQIGGEVDSYDMVIRSQLANNKKGVIYILWDVADYEGNKTIDLGNLGSDTGSGATEGSLAIYGATIQDEIGISAPDFLQIDGDNKLDMVIRSHEFNRAGTDQNDDAGAIYILWDVNDYKVKNERITLDPSATGATAGSLAIHGVGGSEIGTHAPDFLQIDGDNKLDMVIRSEWVKNPDGAVGYHGAIYILWDVEDYKAGVKNKSFELTSAASSGLLTIYGKGINAYLGSNANNILYGDDGDGNKILTNIDGDAAGTNDIAFRDKEHTYILFGDKVANDGDDDGDKVDSKTIDLNDIITVENAADTAGDFFNYDFGGTVVTRVGYRFENVRHADLAAVQEAYEAVPKPTNLSSDADADLGVWDIA